MNAVRLLILAAILLKARCESEEDSNLSLEERLDNCKELNLKLEKRLIEFKFRITELEGRESFIDFLQNSIKVQNSNCENNQKLIDICGKKVDAAHQQMKSRSKGRSKRLHSLAPTSCLSYGYSSKIATLEFPGADSFSILCDGNTLGPGWAVIQSRIDGSENFYRTWNEYRQGFGNLSGEFFIGLQNLYLMTNYEPHELYIQLTDFSNEIFYAHYDLFAIGNEMEKYKLKALGEMTGNLPDKLADHLGYKFSTYDQDNDNSNKENIAIKYHGGWWYYDGNLYGCNLNGAYFDKNSSDVTRLHWKWRGYKAVKMLIRPKNIKGQD